MSDLATGRHPLTGGRYIAEMVVVKKGLLHALGSNVIPNRIRGILSSKDSNNQPLLQWCCNISHHIIVSFSFIPPFRPSDFFYKL